MRPLVGSYTLEASLTRMLGITVKELRAEWATLSDKDKADLIDMVKDHDEG